MSTDPRDPTRPAPSGRRRVPLHLACAEPHSCPAPVRMRVLQRVPLFAGLSDDELTGIDARMTSLAWATGEALYRAGDPAEHLFVMAAGRAKAWRGTPDGQEIVVDLLAPGDLFGGLQILGQMRHAETVQALSTTCALRIDSAAFREMLGDYPQVALRALDETAALLTQARSDVAQVSSATVAQRVAARLVRLADKFGRDLGDGRGTLIHLPLTRRDLAGMTGSTPESVSRVMSALRKDGVIDSGRGWTAVVDRDRLAGLAASE